MSGKEQGLDQCLQVHMLRAIHDCPTPQVAVLMTGDGAGYDDGVGAALLRRGVFALFMGLFARGCVSPVLLSGGQQPSQRVPASFRRPAEPRNGTEHRRSVPLGRAPFWTFARRSGTVPWEGRQTCDGCDDRIPGTYIRRGANRRPLHRSPEPGPVCSGRMLSSRMPKPSSRPAKPGR